MKNKERWSNYDCKHVVNDLKGSKIIKLEGNILSCSNHKLDWHYLLQSLRSKGIKATQTQMFDFRAFSSDGCLDDIDKLKGGYFNRVLVPSISYSGRLNDAILFEFDFANDTVVIDGKSYTVEENRTYTFKFFKKKIKSINGIYGFYKFIVELLDEGSPFVHSAVSSWRDNILNN